MTLQTCVPGKFPLVLMGSRADGLACADPGARTPSALAEIVLVLRVVAVVSLLEIVAVVI